MEHLNALMLGLTTDERLKCRNFYLPRKVVGFEARMLASERAVSRVVESFALERQHMVVH